MEGRAFLQDRVNAHHLDKGRRQRLMQAKARPNSRRSFGQPDDDTKCYNKVGEFACSACLCCVSCPISVLWCCLKLPCKIGWRAVRHAADWACCRPSGKKVFESYSSFSDIDSDSLPRRRTPPSCSDRLNSPRSRIAANRGRANESRCNGNANCQFPL